MFHIHLIIIDIIYITFNTQRHRTFFAIFDSSVILNLIIVTIYDIDIHVPYVMLLKLFYRTHISINCL